MTESPRYRVVNLRRSVNTLVRFARTHANLTEEERHNLVKVIRAIEHTIVPPFRAESSTAPHVISLTIRCAQEADMTKYTVSFCVSPSILDIGSAVMRAPAGFG